MPVFRQQGCQRMRLPGGCWHGHSSLGSHYTGHLFELCGTCWIFPHLSHLPPTETEPLFISWKKVPKSKPYTCPAFTASCQRGISRGSVCNSWIQSGSFFTSSSFLMTRRLMSSEDQESFGVLSDFGNRSRLLQNRNVEETQGRFHSSPPGERLPAQCRVGQSMGPSHFCSFLPCEK